MKTITFIYKHGGPSVLALLFKTENGFLFISHIDNSSKSKTEFYSLIKDELLSVVFGDNELIEVTPKGYEIIKAYYPGSTSFHKEQITMEKRKTTNGIEYFNFELAQP